MSMDELDLDVRYATPDDVAVVAEITDMAYGRYVPMLGRKPQPMTADYREMVTQHDVWLLTLSERPVGVLVLIREEEALLIYSIAVCPESQGQGLGALLLRFAEAQAERAGPMNYFTQRCAGLRISLRLWDGLRAIAVFGCGADGIQANAPAIWSAPCRARLLMSGIR